MGHTINPFEPTHRKLGPRISAAIGSQMDIFQSLYTAHWLDWVIVGRVLTAHLLRNMSVQEIQDALEIRFARSPFHQLALTNTIQKRCFSRRERKRVRKRKGRQPRETAS